LVDKSKILVTWKRPNFVEHNSPSICHVPLIELSIFCSIKPKETKKGFKKDDMVKNLMFAICRFFYNYFYLISLSLDSYNGVELQYALVIRIPLATLVDNVHGSSLSK